MGVCECVWWGVGRGSLCRQVLTRVSISRWSCAKVLAHCLFGLPAFGFLRSHVKYPFASLLPGRLSRISPSIGPFC